MRRRWHRGEPRTAERCRLDQAVQPRSSPVCPGLRPNVARAIAAKGAADKCAIAGLGRPCQTPARTKRHRLRNGLEASWRLVPLWRTHQAQRARMETAARAGPPRPRQTPHPSARHSWTILWSRQTACPDQNAESRLGSDPRIGLGHPGPGQPARTPPPGPILPRHGCESGCCESGSFLSATRQGAWSADPFPARQVTTPHRTGASRPAPAPPPPIPSRPPQPPSRRRLRRSPPTAGGRSEARKPGQAPELAGPTPGRPPATWQETILRRPTPRPRRAPAPRSLVRRLGGSHRRSEDLVLKKAEATRVTPGRRPAALRPGAQPRATASAEPAPRAQRPPTSQ